MKIYRLPAKIRALCFDMDLTLYSHPEYGRLQIDSIVARLAVIRGLSFDEMNHEVEGLRKDWMQSHGGKSPSLSHILPAYGISMEENIRWREELYEPEKFIKEDKRLGETLRELSRSYTLGVLTNNSLGVAERTLALLGVGEYFPIVIGLDTCMCPKPHEKLLLKFSQLSACPLETCVSIGDRYDIDLDLPLEMGMGAILVDGVEDVYKLPETLGHPRTSTRPQAPALETH